MFLSLTRSEQSRKTVRGMTPTPLGQGGLALAGPTLTPAYRPLRRYSGAGGATHARLVPN